MSLPKKPGE